MFVRRASQGGADPKPQARSNANDDMVLEVAVAGGCSHIVTFNRKDFEGVDKFGITVVTPQRFLSLIGGMK